MIAHTLKMIFFVVILSLFFGGAVALASTDSSLCFECHDEDSFKGKIVHSPVADGDCVQCHSPHVSKTEGLLNQPQKSLCLGCHDGIDERLEQSEYIHPPLQKGDCVACHDPHSSENSSLLRFDSAGACYDCHDQPEKAANEHSPFMKGQCNACHDPHSSDDFRFLKKNGTELCLGCHTSNQQLAKKHLGRKLEKLDCLACHNPHGSTSASLLRSVAHEPFADNDCDTCHGQEQSVDVCLQCHEDILPTFNKTYNHLRGNGKENLCVNCHNPHAGDQDKMFPKNMGLVCRSCHEDTFTRRKDALYLHVDWETCTNCHSLHGSDQFAMLKDEPSKTCAECHEDHSTFTHPLGEDALDPRTGQGMTCVSCHDPNVGTQFKFFLRGGAEKGLCVNCHKGY